MKKLIMLALAVVTFASATFATEPSNVNVAVLKSFNSAFSNATQVEWLVTTDFYRAKFISNDQVMYAYYTEEGSLMAITRRITAKQLPISLFDALQEKYAGKMIIDIFEVSSDNDTSYFASLRCGKHNLTLQSGGTQGWRVYKKEKI